MEVIPVLIHMAFPPAPSNSLTVNDSNMLEVSERDPQTHVMHLPIHQKGYRNQSSRQTLMASIRAKRSFIESTDSSSDMNPDSAVDY